MPGLIRWLDETLYPGIGANWDDQAFRERVLAHLKAQATEVLDLGAGVGRVGQMNFKRAARRVTGVDPDPRVMENPHLHEGKIGAGEAIPFADRSFDLVVANNVLEHLMKPEDVFREVYRVLRPGGVLLAKTPNRIHYVPVIARVTPHRFHQWINERRGRKEEDTFPTLYRANTVRTLRTLGAAGGFREVRVDLIESRPEYLRFAAPAYLLGWVWERAVNRVPMLKGFRVVLMAEFHK